MTSTICALLWEMAVPLTWSMALTAVSTAVSTPMASSVPGTSLSIVAGIPTARIPASPSALALVRLPPPPIITMPSAPASLSRSTARSCPSGSLTSLERPVPRKVPPRCTSPPSRSGRLSSCGSPSDSEHGTYDALSGASALVHRGLSLSGDSRLVGVPETVDGGLIERPPDELRANRQAGGGRAAGHGEAREAGEVRRSGKPGNRQADALLVAPDVHFPRVYGRRGYRQRRGEEDVHPFQRPLEGVLRAQLRLLGAGVAVRLEALALHEALANLFAEPLGFPLQSLLVHRVRVGGQRETLRLERLTQTRDAHLPHLRARSQEDCYGLPHLLFNLAIEILEVEVFGDPDHASPDAAVQIAGEILGGTGRGVEIGGGGSGGDTYGAPRVGAQSGVEEVSGDGGTRATAGAAGDPGRVVRVSGGAEVRAVSRRAVCK